MISIAIDGPAASGKSSLAKAIAKRLGYLYVGTGDLYRAIGYHVIQKYPNGYTPDEVEATLPEITLELNFKDFGQRVILNGKDVTELLDEDDISLAASSVSKLPAVRVFLLGLQRDLARDNNIVMDGRDIGTVVLPNATVKIFLTATAEIRAKRRAAQLKMAGKEANYNEILENIITRDINDTTREFAPLKKAEDALELDNTPYNFEENLEVMCKMVLSALRLKNAL